jgi:hypothetical protein
LHTNHEIVSWIPIGERSMNRRQRGRLWWRVAAGVIVVLSASTAALSGTAASPSTARLTSISSTSTAGQVGASDNEQETAATGGTCPPNPTYPSSPTDQTQYEVPFTADILDGIVNVGYNEDTGGPGTKALINMPWFPWMLHVTGLMGTVSGCVPLPGLSLAVQPSNLQINTYGSMQGPDNCSTSQSGCSLARHSSATYSFSGIAEPGETDLPIYLTSGVENVAGATTLHLQTTPVASPGLQVGTPTFTEEYSYPGTGPPTKVDLPAGSPPGAQLDPNIYSGTVTVTNATATTVTSITGEERAGFISGPSTLTAGQTGTYTFSFEGSSSGDLPDEQALPLMFSGEGASGLVNGYGIAYFTFPILDVSSLTITAATINGQPAMTGTGPQVAAGSVFNGTVTLTNDTSSKVTGIYGETGQAVQLLATAAPSGTQAPPLALGDFSLAVSATKPLTATVVGARPDGLGTTPYGSLDSTGTASASGVLSAANPPLACGAPVTTMVTTGSSTVVPASPAGEPQHAAGPQWTVQGEPIAGPLVGATARLVSNSSALQISSQTPPGYTMTCGVYGEAFNWEIGGVEPDGNYYNCPTCTSFGQSSTAEAGAGRGEVQVEIDVLLTSVGGLATCRPTTTTSVACSP